MTKAKKVNTIPATFEPEYSLRIEDDIEYLCDNEGSDIDGLIDWAAKDLTDYQIPIESCSCELFLRAGQLNIAIGKTQISTYVDDLDVISRNVISEAEIIKRIKASKYYKVDVKSKGYKLEQLTKEREELEDKLDRVVKQIEYEQNK